MADPEGELTVAQRLGRMLDRGILPAGGPAEAAERLIERLERPARVALLGLPGSGKSSILNLLVGSVVVSETLRLPTIIVQHGVEARMICTLTDGSSKIVPGSDLSQVLALAPALVTLEMDLPALKVISLLEVSAGPMEAEQRRAATWASKRADIVIWCTTSYLPKEQAVWESLPDSVKDNSFMFLTKVDLLGNRQAAAAMHDRVEQRAGEEFRQILSISAKQARAAMPPGGPVNREMFRESGASGVITAIKTRVQSGRRADMDTAELLLARHVEASELVARRFAEPEPEAEPVRVWTPPPEETDDSAAADEVAAAVEPEADDDVDPVFAEDAEEEVGFSEADAAADEKAEEALPHHEDTRQESDTWPEAAAPDEPEPEAEAEPAETLDADEAAPPEEAPPVDNAEQNIEPEPTTRRRFADRIKRVATASELASTPLVPLRATWKSKSETESQPEPEPVARPAEPVRRPRPAPPMAGGEGETARVQPVVAPPVERRVTPREPAPGAIPVSPPPAADLPRTARPQLFGARRGTSSPTEPGSPLPDLSSLRAQPEVEDTDPEALIEDEDLEDDAAVDDAATVEPEPEPVERAPEPPPVVEPPRPIERPRLFDRQPRARPPEVAPTPIVERQAGAAPLSRSAAPPRPQASVAATEASPPRPRPTADDAQFSPRAIMTRERPLEPEAATPRRERPRIARAVAVPAPQAAPPPAATVDHAILDEAISLIIDRATELEAEIDLAAKLPVDLILDHSRETAEQVIAVVSRGRTDVLRRINSDLGEVLDVIMLMQLEKGHAPADDALTLLLQLRRELETLRVA